MSHCLRHGLGHEVHASQDLAARDSWTDGNIAVHLNVSTHVHASCLFLHGFGDPADVALEGRTELQSHPGACLQYLPRCLQTLTRVPKTNKQLERVTFPCKLQSLTFGSVFNQSLAGIVLPKSQSLTLGDYFDQSLRGETLPAFNSWSLVATSARTWRVWLCQRIFVWLWVGISTRASKAPRCGFTRGSSKFDVASRIEISHHSELHWWCLIYVDFISRWPHLKYNPLGGNPCPKVSDTTAIDPDRQRGWAWISSGPVQLCWWNAVSGVISVRHAPAWCCFPVQPSKLNCA